VVFGLIAWFMVAGLWHHHPRAHWTVTADVAPLDAELAQDEGMRDTVGADLDRRAAAVRQSLQPLTAELNDLSNLSARLGQAVSRANDEDRWPVKVAGRTLSPAMATELSARIATATAMGRRAVKHDTAALQALTDAAATAHGESAEIGRLRQELTAGVSPDRQAEIARQADAFRAEPVPDAANVTADDTRPADLDALIK
jgi:hypothetical protein